VGRTQTQRQAAGDGQGAFHWESADQHGMAKIGSHHVLHGHVGGPVLGLIEIDDFDNVGVAQFNGGLGFAAEAAEKC